MERQRYEVRKIEPLIEEVKSSIKKLAVNSPQPYDLKWNSKAYVKVECKLGNIDLQLTLRLSFFLRMFLYD